MPTRQLGHCGMIVIALCCAIPAYATEPIAVLSSKKGEPLTPIPIGDVAAAHRDAVRQILEKPTISARSQPEAFTADVEAYRYFLDHPDRAVTAWRKIGAKCVSIQNRGKEQFSWTDDNGSDVAWQTVLNQPDLRVWYAEGKVKPGPLLPMVPVKVVVVLRSSEVRIPITTKPGLPPKTAPGLQHQTEMAIHTDSKTAAVVTKMLGPSAQRMAEQGLGQFQFFFGGLGFYLSRHPELADVLMRDDD